METILLVDDSLFMRNILKQTLQKNFSSFQFIEAKNGEEAISLFEQYHPALTFLDITLPTLSGLDVLRNIKLTPKSKVIMCSAMGQSGFVTESFQLGATDFIVKPFQTDKLIASTKKALYS